MLQSRPAQILAGLCFLLAMLAQGGAQVVVDFGSRTSTIAKTIPPHIITADLTFIPTSGSLSQLQQGGFAELRTDAGLASIFASGTTPNWTYIDSRISLLRSVGLRTMIVMGYTPGWLQPHPTTCPVDGYGPTRAAPTDVNRWGQLAAEFVGHIDRTFPGSVSDYEIWQAPDDDDGLCVADHSESTRLRTYLSMYSAAAAAMRIQAKADGVKIPIRIGGPVVVQDLTSLWFTQLLSNPGTSQNVDFVSYHKYGGYTGVVQQGMTWDGAGGTPSLWQLTQNSTTGFAATFKSISSMVKAGKQPNPSSTPIFISEYNDTAAFTNDCCRNSKVYSPVFNAMVVADMLNTVYSGAQNVPGLLGYLGVNSTGDFCLVGVIDTAMDCSRSGTFQPYPQYYAYKLLASAGYLNLGAGGKMAVSTAPPIGTTGLVVTGFYTTEGAAIVVVNPSGSDVTNVSITAKNPGTIHPQATRYLLNSFNPTISTASVTFAVVSGGMQYKTTIPHLSVVAFLLP